MFGCAWLRFCDCLLAFVMDVCFDLRCVYFNLDVLLLLWFLLLFYDLRFSLRLCLLWLVLLSCCLWMFGCCFVDVL